MSLFKDLLAWFKQQPLTPKTVLLIAAGILLAILLPTPIFLVVVGGWFGLKKVRDRRPQ